MTPLNYLTQSSAIINDKLYGMFQQNQHLLLYIHSIIKSNSAIFTLLNLDLDRIGKICQDNIAATKGIIKISDDNEQSANSLWYLNQG